MERLKHSRSLKAFIKIVAITGGLIIALGIIRSWYLEEFGNFHPITPGEAYRSAQLNRENLNHYIKKFKIRSVINLRGESEAQWYRDEIAICHLLGVGHYDIDLSSSKAPTRDDIKEMLHDFNTAPRPVLIHCQAGADRSGLAAALWKVVIDGESTANARKQLSIRYGHLPIGPTQALDRFFDSWMNATRVQSNPEKGTKANLKYLYASELW